MKFSERVYGKLSLVPRGRVTTYQELAKSIGSLAYRAVGTAMRCNPYAPTVPCHRVVKSDGTIGWFRGQKTGETVDEKIKMLTAEGVKIVDGKIQNFNEVKYSF